VIAAGGLAAAAAAGYAAASGGGGGSAPAAAGGVATGVATVARRDLVDRQDIQGTLGFAGARTVAAGLAGTVTRLRAEGEHVARGRSLYSVDGQPTAYVFYGSVPMYRDLRPGVTDGSDVRQLEAGLVALGYDPNGAIAVDRHWGAATTAAVRRWQHARGVEQTGTIARADIVFTSGPVRVGAHQAAVGEAARPGAPVMRISAMRRVVTARLDAARQEAVRPGDAVDVTLPDGSVVAGRVASVGRVASAGQDGSSATVALRVDLRSRQAGAGLDGAPTTLSVATGRTRGALSVPITALLATAGGRYAVEVIGRGGRRHLVAAQPGAYAGAYVEIAGRVRPGTRVAVPR
jgi:peptidoglycan hydrolase-like protein with peptidoglycan-binding domain